MVQEPPIFHINVNRYNFLATYWVKTKPPILGVYPVDLTPEVRQKIGSNKGVVANIIVKNSPAFRADILPGDILKKIGESEIVDSESLVETVKQYAGKTAKVLLLREGKEVTKDILFNKME